jgi:hypothetical protein
MNVAIHAPQNTEQFNARLIQLLHIDQGHSKGLALRTPHRIGHCQTAYYFMPNILQCSLQGCLFA